MLRTLILIMAFGVVGCEHAPQVKPSPFVVGEITTANLFIQHPNFAPSSQNYEVDKLALQGVQVDPDIEFLVLFGAWCHDSERELPRLLAVLEVLGVPESQMTLVGVDFHKRDPGGVSQRYELRFTPTIVVLNDGQEIGRIVERPKISLEHDIAGLLAD